MNNIDTIAPTVARNRQLQISDLQTPAALLDVSVLKRNIALLRSRLERFGVPLRPHLKTAKSAEIWRLAIAGQPGGIAVQTLAEAEYFAEAGCTDILYAVSIVPSKLQRLAQIQSHGVKVTVICDNLENARHVQESTARLGTSFHVLIEIDADGVRSGLRADDAALIPLARQLAAGPGTTLAGVLCHNGSAYDATSLSELVQAAKVERIAALAAAEVIRATGLECATVSVGSSPSALTAESFDDVTEVRAGVYMFQDLTQVELGVCGRGDIAMTVLSTVVSHNRSAGKIVIDAGTLALSKDFGCSERRHAHYGEVVDGLTGEPLGLVVDAMSQEHGIISARQDDFERVPIGSLVRVLPNHACITAASFDHYAVIERRDVIDQWERCRGW